MHSKMEYEKSATFREVYLNIFMKEMMMQIDIQSEISQLRLENRQAESQPRPIRIPMMSM